MKVAILGWYHQNNAGDDRLLYCLQTKLHSLGINDIHVFVAWNDLKTRIDEINSCDFLLVGGGGLILRNTNGQVKNFENIHIPYGLVGVSVDDVGTDNADFISYLSKHSKFILVRDTFSYEAFTSHTKEHLFLAPDLTFLYPYQSKDSKIITNKVAVSLRPWHANPFKQYSKNYHRFNRWARRFPILPKLFGLWDPEAFVTKLKTSVTEQLIAFPLHLNPEKGDDVLMSKYLEFSEFKDFDISVLRQSDYLIGMRLHAVIFATQMGIPFIALNYASKVRNYVEDLGMEDSVLEIENYKAIHSKIAHLKAHQESISKQLLLKSDQYAKEVHSTFDTIYKTYMA